MADPSRYVPPSLQRDFAGDRQRAILLQGEQQAQGHLNRANATADLVGAVGGSAAAYLHQRAENQALSKRDAALQNALSSWDGQDPMALYQSLGMLDPVARIKVTEGMAGLAKLGQGDEKAERENFEKAAMGVGSLPSFEMYAKNYETIKATMGPMAQKFYGVVLDEQPSKEDFDALKQWARNAGAKDPQREKVEQQNADGTTTTTFVDPSTAGPIVSAAAPITAQQAAQNALEAQRIAEQNRHNRSMEANQPKGDQPNWQWVNRGGKPVHTNQIQAGDEPLRAPQGGDPTRMARVQSAQSFLTRLNELRAKINTKMGPSAGLTGYARRGAANIGMDPDVAEYERLQKAAGRSLAAAIMGAANLSDADADAWGGMLPDALTDQETAGRLMTDVATMLNGGEAPAKPPGAAGSEADALLDKYLGGR